MPIEHNHARKIARTCVGLRALRHLRWNSLTDYDASAGSRPLPWHVTHPPSSHDMSVAAILSPHHSVRFASLGKVIPCRRAMQRQLAQALVKRSFAAASGPANSNIPGVYKDETPVPVIADRGSSRQNLLQPRNTAGTLRAHATT